MQEQLITFETAKLAKEKGFDFKVYKEEKIYDKLGYLLKPEDEVFPNVEYFPAPTQTLLQKWLREVHNLYVDSYHDLTSDGKSIQYYTSWGFLQQKDIDGNQNVNGWYDEYNDYKTYEEALEIGLQEALKLIEIVKNK
jgi:hypothetical protein